MTTLIGFLMIGFVVFLLIKDKFALAPVFVLIPTVASLLCGFSLQETAGFVADGINSVLNTALLFVFSILYFGILGDIGIFELLVQKVVKILNHNITILMIATALLCMLIQMDGSGAMTILIMIPAMLPIFDAMRIPRVVLVYLVSSSTAISNMFPWCSAMLRLSAASGVDSMEIWKYMIPIQAAAIFVTLFIDIWISIRLKRHGSGISKEDFLQLKKQMGESAKLKVPMPIAVFDVCYTIILLALLLMGYVTSTFAFMFSVGVILIVNFRDVKEQNEKIKKHGTTAYPLVLVIFCLGAMVGIMKGSGMVNAIAQAFIALIPRSLGQFTAFLYGLIGVPVSMIVGSDCCYSILTPILGEINIQYGGNMLQACAAVIITSSMAANISLVGAVPYLSIGLAGITMKDNIKPELFTTLPRMWLKAT